MLIKEMSFDGTRFLLENNTSEHLIEGRRLAKIEMAKKTLLWLYNEDPSLMYDPAIESVIGVKKRMEDKLKYKYWLITVNFPFGVDPAEVVLAYERIVNKVWVRPIVVGFEGDGKDKHYHIHMLVKKNKRKSEVLREVHNTVKSHCSKESVDVRPIREKDKEKVIDYCKKDGDYRTDFVVGDKEIDLSDDEK